MEQAPEPERPESAADVQPRFDELHRLCQRALAMWRERMPQPDPNNISFILLCRSTLRRFRERYQHLFHAHPSFKQRVDALADALQLDAQGEQILEAAQRRHGLLPRGEM